MFALLRGLRCIDTMFAEVEDFIVDVNNQLIEGAFGAQVSILDTIEMTLGAIRAERALDTFL